MKRIFTFVVAMCLMTTALMASEIYKTNFQTEEEFNEWVVVDSNDDGSKWTYDVAATPTVFYSYNAVNPADDWLISPAITSTETGTLAVSFVFKGSSYGEKVELFYGVSQTVDAMTNRISEVLNLNDTESSHLYLLDVTANEPIYLGIHACSDADKWRLYVGEVKAQFSTNPVDIQVSEIISPVSDFGLDQETVTVKIKNSGNVDVESFDVTFGITDVNTVVQETVNQPLVAGAEMEYTFTSKVDLSEARKLYTIMAFTSHPDDVNQANDACNKEVLHKAPATVPYFMSFEADEYTDGITYFNLNGDDGDWTRYTDPWWNLARTGDYCLAYNYSSENNAEDWAILEPIKIEEAGYYVLKFWYSGDDTHPEKLGVYYGNIADPSAMTNKIVEYAPFARSEYEESINIIYIDQPQDIYIGFYAFSNKDENWICVDDISFEKIDSESVDLMVLPVTNPTSYVHNSSNKNINFKVRNLGIKDVETTVRVTLSENEIYNEKVTIAAQEIKDFALNDVLKNLVAGEHTINVEVIAADDANTENNAVSSTFRVLNEPALAWNFEDGQLPTDFIFRVEDEGTINPGAGAEFNEYGWGIFNIQEHDLYGEYVMAGTSWLDGTDQADRWCILPPFKPTEESFLLWDVSSFNANYLEDYAIMISTNGDDSWYYYTEAEFIAETPDFKTRGIDLNEYVGKSIYIAFRLKSKNCEHLILDNIELYGGEKVTPLNIEATVTPTEGVVEKLDKFTVQFENVESVTLDVYPFYPPYIATVAEDGTLTKLASAKASIIEGQSKQISIEITEEGMTEITEDGKYALVIPSQDLIFNDDSNLLIANKEFIFNYQIGETVVADGAMPILISPANGSTVKELQTVLLQFSADDYPNTMSYDYTKAPILYNEAGEEVAIGHYGYGDATYFTISVIFDEPITTEGVYTLKIGAGDLHEYEFGVASPRICPAIELTYTIGDVEPQYTISVTPVPGDNIAIEEINVFTVTFEGVKKIDFTTEAWSGYVLRVDEKGNTLEEFPATCEMISDVAYTVTMDRQATEFGIYRLVIPEAAVTVNDNEGASGPNKKATFDYNVTYSSVESIATEASEFNVYSINGVCVLKNANVKDLKSLDKGIYVIKGQKVIIHE